MFPFQVRRIGSDNDLTVVNNDDIECRDDQTTMTDNSSIDIPSETNDTSNDIPLQNESRTQNDDIRQNENDQKSETNDNSSVTSSDNSKSDVNVQQGQDQSDQLCSEQTVPSVANAPLRRSNRSNRGIGPNKLSYHQPGEQYNADFKLALVQQMRAFMENLL